MKRTKKSMIILTLIVFVLSFMAIIPAEACACGMLIPEDTKEIEMEGEQGIVVYDKAEKKEQMAIYFELSGSSNSSALIVPTPVQAEISQIKKEVLEDLYLMANPPTEAFGIGDTLAPTSSGIEVLEQKEVGEFEVSALRADSYQSLYDWAKENEYQLSEKYENIVRTYIDSDFVLNLIKLKKDGNEGDINPLIFTFNSDELFYPLMTLKNDDRPSLDTTLTLYLLTDEEIDLPSTSIKNRKYETADLVDYEISQTTDEDFDNLEFTADEYYFSVIETDDYAEDTEISLSLANPEYKVYASLNLDYSDSSTESIWDNKYYSWIAIITIIAAALGLGMRQWRAKKKELQ